MQLYCSGREKGTSLMEVLIGILILVMVTLITSSIVATTFKSAVKSRVLKEVKQNGDYAMTVMGRAIINAAELSDVTTCVNVMNSLQVKNADGTETEFALSVDGTITQNNLNITSSDVLVSGLNFECIPSLTKGEYITVSFHVQQRGAGLCSEQNAACLDFMSAFTVRN